MSDLGLSTAKLIKNAKFPVFYEMAVEDGDVMFQENNNLLKFLRKEDSRNVINSLKKMNKAINTMKLNLKVINKKAILINQSN